MNRNELLENSIIENLGWTLLHSLWQIALIALVLFLVLQILRSFPANVRYLAATFALLFAAALPVVTFVQLSRSEKPNSAQTANSNAIYNRRIQKDLRAAEDFSSSGKLKTET